MIARILTGLVGAAGLVVLVVWGVGEIRKDARNDLLRELELKQEQGKSADQALKEAIDEDIQNSPIDAWRQRACDGGWLRCEGDNPDDDPGLLRPDG